MQGLILPGTRSLNYGQLSSVLSPMSARNLGWWKCLPQHFGGPTLIDISRNKNHGVLTNDPTWVGCSGGDSRNGTFPGALNITGGVSAVAPNVLISTPRFVSLNSVTIILCFQADAVGTYNGLFISRTGGGSTCGILISGHGHIGYLWEDTTDEYDVASGLVTSIGRWYFVALVVTPTAATIYQGDFATGGWNSFTNTKTHNVKTCALWRLGADVEINTGLDGRIDDASIWNTSIPESTLRARFSEARSGNLGYPTYLNRSSTLSTFLMGAESGSGGNTTLTASTGSYIESGQPSELRATRYLSASTGSFVFTGKDATLSYGHVNPTTSTPYVLIGNAVNLLHSHKLVCTVGDYILTGQEAGLIGNAKIIIGSTGVYSLTGINASVLYGHKELGTVKEFTLTGNDANLLRGRVPLTADTVSYLITGIASDFSRTRVLQAITVSYVLTGLGISFEAPVIPIPEPEPEPTGGGEGGGGGPGVRRERQYPPSVFPWVLGKKRKPWEDINEEEELQRIDDEEVVLIASLFD